MRLTRPTTSKPRHRARLTVRALVARTAVAALMAGAIATGIVTTGPAQPAVAGTYGPGQWVSGFFHGAYIESGTGSLLYCLEIDRAEPIGVGPVASSTGQVPGLTAAKSAGINWLVSTHGQTSDDYTARSVQEALWLVLGTYPGSGTPLAQQLAAQVNAYVLPAAGSPGSISMAMVVDQHNNYDGHLNISSLSHAGATGTIALTNGIFLATDSATITGSFNAGDSFAVRGVPPTPGQPYKITAATVAPGLSAPITAGYGPEVGILTYPGNYQHLVTAGPPAPTVAYINGSAFDPTDRSSAFYPELSTTVATTRVSPGDYFQDVVTFSLGANDDGIVNEWPRLVNGSYHPVVAQCTVFGPLTQHPAQSATPPAGTPVATSFTVTTSTADGPTVGYPVQSDDPLTAAGFYTAVCSIDIDDQSPFTQALMAADYVYADDFGQVAETAWVPMGLEVSTQLAASTVGFGQPVADAVTVNVADGSWLRDVSGAPVPVELVGRSYFVTTEPVVAASPPGGAVLLETINATATSAGTFLSAPFTAPTEAGWLVVQWCVVEGQFVQASCDDWGVASETARVEAPIVSTLAQPSSAPGSTIADVVVVAGTVPAGGLLVSFAGYLQPENATAPVCLPTNRVFASSAPVHVTAPGDFSSEAFAVRPEHAGTIFWIETATLSDGVTVVAVGECGLPNETSIIQWPTLTTTATAVAAAGGGVIDVATLTGQLPDPTGEWSARLQFEAFWTVDEKPSCTPAKRVHLDDVQLDLAAVVDDYESAPVPRDQVRAGWLWHVATLVYTDTATGQEVVAAVGECGDPLEKTQVTALATTGTSSLLAISAAALAAVLLGAALLLSRRMLARSR